MKLPKALEITKHRISVLSAQLDRMSKSNAAYREVKDEKEALEMILEKVDKAAYDDDTYPINARLSYQGKGVQPPIDDEDY